MSRRNRAPNSGFTILEVMVAIVVLTIGLVGTAALMSTTVNSTARSHLMSTAALLASEKLEDLGRFDKLDTPVQPGGSIAANTTGYFDNVQISVSNGQINETTTTNGVSTSYVQTPTAGMTVTPNAGLPAVSSDTLTFNRRWVINNNTPTAGVRTVTVLVTATTLTIRPQVTFQMSMVRP
ncbi:MAG TPA: prepilin-type N-terminal cleavage/methylation domain-containing protein [Candidatus Acidoferrum sp.]|jgi:prepilin-type N-terminal cleavage/methylation domain-containing protein|nr:prepilin-type N-terminal cleavage/methylation domain-containing protein [Candidatus Acidoferrum sp.]